MMRDWRVMSRWKPIPSCPGYEASDYGRIYSVRSKRLLGGTKDRYGYYYVNIMVGGERVKRKVHRLVCEAWHGPCPDGHECGHSDGSSSNNRAENLAWITRSQNEQHKFVHGTRERRAVPRGFAACVHRGIDNGNAKLTIEQVQAIRRRVAAGETCRPLGREYGVSKDQINRVARGIAYSEASETPNPSSSPAAGR